MAKAKTHNLYEEFSYMGYWRRPEDRKKKWAGRVSYDPESGIELELIAEEGEFASLLDPPEHEEVLLGTLPDSPYWITVLGAWRSETDVKYPEAPTEMVRYKFRAQYLLVGHWFRSPRTVLLNSVELTFSSLRGWMWTQPPFLRERNLYDDTTNGRYILSRKEFFVPSIESKIVLRDVVEEKSDHSERHQERECFIRIESETPKSLECFVKLIGKTRQLLAFLTGMPIQRKSIVVPPGEVDSLLGRVDIYFFVNPPKEDATDNYGMPFQYSMLGNLTPSVFQAWFQRDEESTVPFDLCLDVIYNEQKYSRFEFLALVQALESHHRLHFEEQGKKKQRYKYANGKVKRKGPDLIDRLEELFENLPDFLLLDSSLNKNFLQLVKDSRNYYTHYNSRDHEKAMKGLDLYNAISHLVPFIGYFLYSKLNIPDEKVSEGFSLAAHKGLWSRPNLYPLLPDEEDE